jgi:hypothetical protein
MRHLQTLILCLIAACLLLMPSPARAQLAPVTVRDGKVLPLSFQETIRLESQEVTIRLHRGCCRVEASFRLVNTGPTVTQWIGIWKYIKERHILEGQPIAFDGWIDGTKVAFAPAHYAPTESGWVAEIQEYPGPRWMVREVTFPGHAATTIRVRYDIQGLGSVAYEHSRYWKGNIRKAAFTIDRTNEPRTWRYSIIFPSCPGPRMITDDLEKYELQDSKPPSKGCMQVNKTEKRE